jgi:hypothetical protein
MKNNKIIMSLVLASISAMAAAPFLLDEKKDEKKKDVANKDDATDGTTTVVEGKKLIDLDSVKTAKMDDSVKDDFTKQMDAMLMKKSSVQQLSESVSILVDNYGHEDQSLRDEIYKELNFAQGTQDSTGAGMGISPPPGSGWSGGTTIVCHSACHVACHVACHGSRGWR